MSRRADARHTSLCARDKHCSCIEYQQGYCHLLTVKRKRKGSHALFLRLLRVEPTSASGSSPGELILNAETAMAGVSLSAVLGPRKHKISGFPKYGVMRDYSKPPKTSPDNAVVWGSLLYLMYSTRFSPLRVAWTKYMYASMCWPKLALLSSSK